MPSILITPLGEFVMDFPKIVYEIVNEEAEKNKNDIQKAVESTMKRVRKLPEFPTLADLLFMRAMRELLENVLNKINHDIKKKSGCYGGPAKVVVGNSKIIRQLANEYYDFRMGGRTLGDLYGYELDEIGNKEFSVVRGNLFRAKLCRYLRKKNLVPEDKRVREVMGVKKLGEIFKAVEEEVEKEAA
jgi:hypothetical protein